MYDSTPPLKRLLDDTNELQTYRGVSPKNFYNKLPHARLPPPLKRLLYDTDGRFKSSGGVSHIQKHYTIARARLPPPLKRLLYDTGGRFKSYMGERSSAPRVTCVRLAQKQKGGQWRRSINVAHFMGTSCTAWLVGRAPRHECVSCSNIKILFHD